MWTWISDQLLKMVWLNDLMGKLIERLGRSLRQQDRASLRVLSVCILIKNF